MDTSSQVSAPDDAEMEEAALEEIPAAPSPTAETPGPSSGAPHADAEHLWEEANKALGGLLATKSSIEAHQQKLVWELGMDLCQNDSETTESIKEANATCTRSIQEAETVCSMAFINAEAWGASQVDSLQQTIKEESKGQLDFLSACQAALQASPVELHSTLVASYHILLGQAPMSHPFSLSQGASSEQVSAPVAPSPPVPEHSRRPKWQHPSPDLVDVLPPSGTMSKATPEGLPSSKQWEVMLVFNMKPPRSI